MSSSVKQTVNIHIHEKSEKKKRRRRRKKVSTSGSIRSINRTLPSSSSSSQGVIPQRRFSQQQLIALPEGDKALGQSGMLGYKVPQPQQLMYQKELMKLAMKEYEAEVEGKSLKDRVTPVGGIPRGIAPSTTPQGIEPSPTPRKQKAVVLKPLKDIHIESIMRTRRDEAIADFNIKTENKNKRTINKEIRQKHEELVGSISPIPLGVGEGAIPLGIVSTGVTRSFRLLPSTSASYSFIANFINSF